MSNVGEGSPASDAVAETVTSLKSLFGDHSAQGFAEIDVKTGAPESATVMTAVSESTRRRRR
jgi:hypothetical protein